MANLLMSYNFDNWQGTVESTPGYPFRMTAQSYLDAHNATTQPVTSYTDSEGVTCTPRPGSSHFLLINAGPNMSPMPPGITGWETESRTNIGYDGAYGGDLEWLIDDNRVANGGTGQYFTRFYVMQSDWKDPPAANLRLKLLRYEALSDNDQLWYVTGDASESYLIPQFLLVGDEGTAGDWYSNAIPDWADGSSNNWHRVSMWVNYVTEEVAIWYDVENESVANATYYRDYSLDVGIAVDAPDVIVPINNWSAQNPTENIWFGLTDIEIYDGIPGAAASNGSTAFGSGATSFGSGTTSFG